MAATVDGARLFPLTPTQQGLLFHRFLDDHAGTDVQQLVYRWHEPPDLRALERAWQRLGEQHPVLRTGLRWEGLPEPRQEVHDAVAVPVERPAGSLEEYLEADRRRGFDLTQPPLFRVALFGNAMVWSFHHVLLDTPSVRMLLEELLALYDALRDGRDALLRARAPFRTFAEWLHARDLGAAEAFWRERLRGFTAPTPLPSLPVESRETHAEFTMDMWGGLQPAALDGLKPVSTLPVSTLPVSTLLIAAWGALLARTSGESDVVFGVAESRRANTVAGAESMLGLFVNTIPVRVRLSDSDTAGALLERVQREQEEARPHEQAPLASIQRWSDVRGGLFDSLLVIEEKSIDAELHERTSYPLTLTAWLDTKTLRFAWDPRRFDEATIRRMAGHLRMLLTAMPQSPDTPVLRLPMLTEEERRQLLYDWNDTRADYPRDTFVHQLFEQRVAMHPDRIALRFNDETLTYAELNRRADRIAHRLRALGVGPDSFVGIFLERSTEMIAALLGILKAGGAYVPLDPSYPKDRLELMLEDSRAAVLLTQPSLDGVLETHGARTLVLEESGGQAILPVPGDDEDRQDCLSSTDSLAYVIYTSGSTGKPKGVQLPHRAVVNFLETMRREPGLTEDDVVIGLTTLSFDIAGLEIYLPLTTGAQLVLVGREVAADARRLSEVITRSNATVVQATPATWRMLLDAGWQGSPRLKLLCGGEALARDLADRLLERCGSLWNMYGPTETTIWSTVRRVTPGRTATVPIGKPIANTQVYVLDPALEPVPIGVPGELHIGGDGVARGYLNRPELTAERFIRDPFVGDPNARMYKTGDAVRWLPNGELEYLNRLDNQVKLRGYRIELGEIENALRKHDGVADAVVIVRGDGPGGSKVLVAYWIAEGEPVAPAELKAFLKESLPEYMVPAFFVRLDELPLTPNGKVDRKVLPPPERTANESEETSVAPRDEIEQRLARIWCDVLRLPSVGVHDNFFELGGESLLAVQMFVRIEAEFGRELPLATLLQAGTIESLAERLRNDGWEAPWSSLIPIQPNGTKRPLFWVHGVGGNVLNYRPLAMRLGPDQPFYGLQARGMDGKQQPLATIEEMAAAYLAEIRKVQPRGPYHLGGASFGGVVAYEIAQQLRAAGDEAAFVALLDTNAVDVAGAKVQTRQSLWTRIRLHLGILLRGPDRWDYLKKKERRLRRKTVYRIWQTVFALFQKFNRPLPQSLQDVAQNNYRALRIYKAKPYDGRVGLFCAKLEPEEFTEAKQRGWKTLVPSLEIYDVDGDHLTMVEEPHVPDLAGKLSAAFLRE
ncbi:MAG TPA: amino acid adenylation domain-containing protein [Thermoanaerobaculia bacterium]